MRANNNNYFGPIRIRGISASATNTLGNLGLAHEYFLVTHFLDELIVQFVMMPLCVKLLRPIKPHNFFISGSKARISGHREHGYSTLVIL